MDKRKPGNDRRKLEDDGWKAIMDTVRQHKETADSVDKHLKDLRSTVDKWASMSTTKGVNHD